MDVVEDLQGRIGHTFANRSLVEQALRHPSWVAEHPDTGEDNQRMEFLGDAVLQLTISALLFHTFSDLDEGVLTRLRAKTVRTEALAEFAQSLGIDRSLQVGKGEEQHGGRQRPSNLADAFEAVLAALYLDGGLEAARPLCRRLMDAVICGDPLLVLALENPKGTLQERAAAQNMAPPEYVVESVTGPEHAPAFTVAVRVDGRTAATARAGSRKEAEQNAAALALRNLAHLP